MLGGADNPNGELLSYIIGADKGKQGEDTESKISVVCTYFRLTMDGKELVEIDTINMIEKVNGVDRLEQHRRNIGL